MIHITFKNNIPLIPVHCKFGKKDLAEVSGLSLPTIRKEINALLSDHSIKLVFGSNQHNRFSQSHLNILTENLQFLDHLKGLRYE